MAEVLNPLVIAAIGGTALPELDRGYYFLTDDEALALRPAVLQKLLPSGGYDVGVLGAFAAQTSFVDAFDSWKAVAALGASASQRTSQQDAKILVIRVDGAFRGPVADGTIRDIDGMVLALDGGRQLILLASHGTPAQPNTSYHLVGETGFSTMIHEIGHALGLHHSFAEGAKPGVPAGTDSESYSVMSYTTHAGHATVMPQLYDIGVAQSMFGSNTQTRVAANSLYRFLETPGAPLTNDINGQTIHAYVRAVQQPPGVMPMVSIYDAGQAGDGDTIDATGITSRGVHIDLNGGAFSRIGSVVDNVSIAYGTVIENAVGSSYDDVLIGNEFGNELIGAEGNDRLYGRGAASGTDILRGGAGRDRLFVRTGSSELYGQEDADAFYIYAAGNHRIADANPGADDHIFLKFGNGEEDTLAAYAPIVGLFYQDAGGWRSPAGQVVTQGGGGTTISGANGISVVVLNFESRDFGIQLMPAQRVPVTTRDIFGDRKPQDQDLQQEGIQTARDSLGNIITNPDEAEPGRSDQLFGSAANDFIDAGDGRNFVMGKGGDDHILALGEDRLDGGDGDDLIESGVGADVVIGGSGDDQLYADRIVTVTAAVVGGAGNGSGEKGDWLAGGTGADIIVGGADDDVLAGGAGEDLLIAGAGNDNIMGDTDWVADNFDWFYADSPGGDRLFSTVTGARDPADSGADMIYAGSGVDYVWAGGGADVVYGEGGSDHLHGEGGADSLFGGAGDDLITGDFKAGDVPGEAHGDDYVDGGEGDDTIHGNGGSDTLYGGTGDDSIIGDAFDLAFSYHGDDFADGGEGDDVLLGFGGDDTLYGSAGNDVLYGDSSFVEPTLLGNDYLSGGGGDDTLFGGHGDDTLNGGTGVNILAGGFGNDTFVIGPEAGGSTEFGFDLIDDVDGVNSVTFGAGLAAASLSVLSFTSDDGNPYLEISQGQNWGTVIRDGLLGTISHYAFADGTSISLEQLIVDAGPLKVYGNDTDNVLFGSVFADSFYGLAGNDDIRGGAGDDTFDGGLGDDRLSGNAGNDRYGFSWGMGRDVAIDPDGGVIALGLNVSIGNLYAQTLGADLFVGIAHSTDGVLIKDYQSSAWRIDAGDGQLVSLSGLPAAPAVAATHAALFDDALDQARADYYRARISEGFRAVEDGSMERDVITASQSFWGAQEFHTNFVVFERTLDDIQIARESMTFPITNRVDYTFSQKSWQVTQVTPGGRGGGYGGSNAVFVPLDDSSNGFKYDPLHDTLLPVDIDHNGSIDGWWLTRGATGGSGGGSSTTVTQTYTEEYSKYQTDYVVEVISGGSGDNVILAQYNPTVLTMVKAGGGNDTVIGNFGLRWSLQTDTATPGIFADGGAGNDVLLGSGGKDQLIGGEGNDILEGHGGADTYFVLTDESGYDLIADEGAAPAFYGGRLGDFREDTFYKDAYYRSLGITDWRSLPPDSLPAVPATNDFAAWEPFYNQSMFEGSGNEAAVIRPDTVQFVGGVSLTDLSISWGHVARESSYATLNLDWGPDRGVRIMMPHTYDTVGTGIEYFTFADGTRVTMGQMLTLAPAAPDFNPQYGPGTEENDAIEGTAGADVMSLGAGNDYAQGLAGNDYMAGGAGNDQLRGGGFPFAERKYELSGQVPDPHEPRNFFTGGNGSGNDALFGGEGNDELYGDDGSSLLAGGDGDDLLQGEDATMFAGGTGNDRLEFKAGFAESVIAFNRGDGQDTYSGPAGELVLSLGDGIQAADLTLTRSGADLIVGFGQADSIRVEDWNDTLPTATLQFFTNGVTTYDLNGLVSQFDAALAANPTLTEWSAGTSVSAYLTEQSMQWARGGALAYQYAITGSFDAMSPGQTLSIIDHENFVLFDQDISGAPGLPTIEGTPGDDVLIGTRAAETIIGHAGNDTLQGGAGNDVYEFNPGDGVDTIVDDGGSNVLKLGAGITPDMLHYEIGADGESLIVGIGSGDDAVHIDFDVQFADSNAVQAFQFADGTSLDLDALLAPGFAFDGTEAADVIEGTGARDVIHALGGDDTVDAGYGNDEVFGGDGADVLDGGDGDDHVDGGAGNDSLSGSYDNDQLDGAAGDDVISGGYGDDVLNGGAGNDQLDGGFGNDTYRFGRDGGQDVVSQFDYGFGRVDTIAFDTAIAPADVAVTADGLDVVFSIRGTDDSIRVANYSAGDEFFNPFKIDEVRFANGTVWDGATIAVKLAGGAGDPPPVGTEGNDSIAGTIGDDMLSGLGGDDLIAGNDGNDTLLGGAGNDSLLGDAGNDALQGGDGNDVLDGGAGADSMAGGAGDDVYAVNDNADIVIEAASEGVDTVQTAVSYSLGDNIENLTLTDVAAINATGNSLDNVLTGISGANTLDGGAGADTMAGGGGDDTYVVDNIADAVTETLNAGTDSVRSAVTYALGANVENLTLTGVAAINGTGNSLDNVLTGNSAGNTLDGGAGADTMIGGLGDDSYVVDNAGDVITEAAGEGTDTVLTALNGYALGANLENVTLQGTAALTVTGNNQNNVLTGNAGNNELIAGGGNDTLDGGAGADGMYGENGDDLYLVDNAGDAVNEGLNTGIDTVRSTVSYALTNQFVENLTLVGATAINATGNTMANTLTGNAANNVLNGGAGNDTLDAGEGNDILDGGAGDDVLLAGDGDDLLIWNGGVDSFDGGTGIDTADFSALGTSLWISLLPTGGASTTGGPLLTSPGWEQIASVATIENVVGTQFQDYLGGDAGANVLSGGAGNDSLDAGDGNDTLYGGVGNDFLNAGAGNDILDGGAGLDTAHYSGARSAYTITQAGATYTVTGPEGSDTLTNIERIEFSDAVFKPGVPRADMNADGRSDLLWRNSNGQVVTWQMNGAQHTTNEGFLGPGPDWRIADGHGDYNGDGKSDILWRHTDGTMVIWQMDGAGVPALYALPAIGNNWNIVDGHADYNGDGRNDILLRSTDGTVRVWQMNGGTVALDNTLVSVPLDWSIVSAHGDYNGDGTSDIFWRNADGRIDVWMMGGSQIASGASLAAPPASWSIVDAQGDYNGDDKSDILWRTADGSVRVWQMNGAAVLETGVSDAIPLDWAIVGHGDYNGDGTSDLLWRNVDGRVDMWTISGAQNAGGASFGGIPLSWSIVDAQGDYNGDGKSDVLWRNTDGTLQLWQMNGGQIISGDSLGVVPQTWTITSERGASLNGTTAANAIVGTVGNDTIAGKEGSDTLTGGAGMDSFVFDTALNSATNVDTITDFMSTTDKLLLSEVFFTGRDFGLVAPGSFVAEAGAAAHEADDFILYNTSTGSVSYDADGSGAQAAVQFAMLANHPLLAASDLHVGLL